MTRLRFSLRSLICAVLLIAASGGLWYRWEPWVKTRTALPDNFTPVQFSPDGSSIIGAVGGTTHHFAVFDVRTGSELFRVGDDYFSAHEKAARLTPNGERIVVSETFTVMLYDAANGKFMRELIAVPPNKDGTYTTTVSTPPLKARMSRDSRYIAADNWSVIGVFDTATGGKLLEIPFKYGGDYTFSRDSRDLICAHGDGVIRQFSCANGNQVSSSSTAVSGWPELSPNGTCVLQHPAPSQFRLSDTSGKFISSGPFSGLRATWSHEDQWVCVPGVTQFIDLRIGTRRESTGSCASQPSGNDQRVLIYARSGFFIIEPATGRKIQRINSELRPGPFNNAGDSVLIGSEVWNCRHSDEWWGCATLPEFWIAIISFAGLTLSVRSNWKKS